MTVYSITIPGRPVPKGRPRVARKGRGYIFYTPKETKHYEQAVNLAARAVCKKPLEGPVAVKVRLYFKKKGKIPDCDNCVKSIFDGLCGAAFLDDSQVMHLEIDVYRGTPERAEVEVMKHDAGWCRIGAGG